MNKPDQSAVDPVRRKRVLLIGNLNIDLIIRDVPRLPGWGREVLGAEYRQVSSGQSAYTAFALGKYGIETSIVSSVGADMYGDQILADLKAGAIDTGSIHRSHGGRTGITVAIVRPDGERAFVSDPSSLKNFHLDDIKRSLPPLDTIAVAGVVGTFFLPGLSIGDIDDCLRTLRSAGVPTLLDTGWDPGDWPASTVKQVRTALRHVDFFLPNMDEARALTGCDSPRKAAESLLDDGCGMVIIKMGADGSYLKTTDLEISVPAFEARVLDTVGAGDVYNAGFIFGTLQGWPPLARMIFGSATASLYISRTENRFPELDPALQLASGHSQFTLKEKRADDN